MSAREDPSVKGSEIAAEPALAEAPRVGAEGGRPAPATAPHPVGRPPPLGPAEVVALQRTAGNAKVNRYLERGGAGAPADDGGGEIGAGSRAWLAPGGPRSDRRQGARAGPVTGAPVLARQNGGDHGTATASIPAAEKIRAALASGDDNAVERLTDADLGASTAVERASLIRILTDLTWTSAAEEQATMRILRHGGEHQAVIAQLDAIGYRQRLLESIDDEGLHAELERLLGGVGAPGGADGPIGRALQSQSWEDVMAVTDFAEATNAQRLGLLRILLDMGASDPVEEAKILTILESAGAGLGALVADIKAMGLKQRLFDHIDDAAQKERLTRLLSPLRDPELDADLAVFNRGGWESFGAALSGGFAQARAQFSIGALVMGFLQPIIHPIDTILHHVQQVEDAVKAPSIDRILTAARDICGTLAVWVGLLALIALGVTAAVAAGIITLPAAIPLAAITAFLVKWTSILGIAFVVLAAVKLVLDIGQATAATTRGEEQEEQRQVGESGITVVVALAFLGLARGLRSLLARFRGSGTDAGSADPAQLRDQAAQGEQATRQAEAEGQQLQSEGQAVEQGSGQTVPPPPPVPEPATAGGPGAPTAPLGEGGVPPRPTGPTGEPGAPPGPAVPPTGPIAPPVPEPARPPAPPAPTPPPVPEPARPPAPQTPPLPEPPAGEAARPPAERGPVPAEPAPAEPGRAPGERGPAPEETPAAPELTEAQRGYRPCFLPGTLVETPDGPRRIEQLRAGDRVVGRDPADPASHGAHPVEDAHTGRTRRIVSVVVGGDALLCTSTHPFFVPERGWVEAEALRPGDRLERVDGAAAVVERAVPQLLASELPTHNLRVAAVHTYFVHTAAGPVLVHNGGDDLFDRTLYWVLGKQHKLRGTDTDGLSVWRTNNRGDVETLMRTRVQVVGRKVGDVHSYLTPQQLEAAGLAAPETPGTGPLAEAGLQHCSVRPVEAPPYAVAPELTPEQHAELGRRLQPVQGKPVKPSDVKC